MVSDHVFVNIPHCFACTRTYYYVHPEQELQFVYDTYEHIFACSKIKLHYIFKSTLG